MKRADGTHYGAGTAKPPSRWAAWASSLSPGAKAEYLRRKRARRRANRDTETPEQRERRLAQKRASAKRTKAKDSSRFAERYYTDTAFADNIRERSRVRYADKVARGVCTSGACEQPCMSGLRVCEHHWWRGKANELKLGRGQHTALRAHIEKLGFSCAYSGRRLTPGVDLGFDHVVPKSSPEFPGYDVLTNVVPCHVNVNIMKNNLPVAEFIRLCTEVACNNKERNRVASVV